MSGGDDPLHNDPLHDDPERIERRIAESRWQVAQALAALDRTLSPRRLAGDAVKALGRATNVTGTADITDGSKLMIDIVKRHPIPAALIAAGIGWAVFDVLFAAERSPAPAGAGPADATRPLTGSASADDLSRDTPGGDPSIDAARVGDTSWLRRSVAADNPLAVGALGLVAGALLGAVLPLTRRDRAWRRASQDWLGDQAETLGRDALEIAEAAGRAALEVVRQEIAAATCRQDDPDDAAPNGNGTRDGNGARQRTRRH